MIGKLNKQSILIDKICKHFFSCGFNIVFGNEIVTFENNFTRLNVERDAFITKDNATLYLTDTTLLRSHLSSIWLQELQKHVNQPYAFLEIGKVYRHEGNTLNTRSVFYQAEGVVVGEGISIANLKGIMQDFVDDVLGDFGEMVFHPWWHPFTNLGVSVNLKCSCGGNSHCQICKGAGTIDIATAGMINEKILTELGFDKKYTAISFGLGPTRISQIVEGIQLRDLYSKTSLSTEVYYGI